MDGTTATTLAPSEDEMNKITEVFGKMRDTVIAASALAKEVGELRNAVGDLRKEVDHLRETNHWLDQQCTELRTQRDQAIRDKSATIDELNRAKSELDLVQHHFNNQQMELARLNDEIAKVKRERDDANFRVLELEEAKEASDKRLAAVQSALGIAQPVKELEPIPQPSPEAEQPRAASGQFQPKARPWWEEQAEAERKTDDGPSY